MNATLGYAGSYTVVVPSAGSQPPGAVPARAVPPVPGPSMASRPGGAGTFTALPSAGQVVARGRALLGEPGRRWRCCTGPSPRTADLSEGMSGTDVRQLNADLVALGDAPEPELDPGSDYFGAATAARWTSSNPASG